MFKLIGVPNANGFFSAFETLDDEAAKEALRSSFSTVDQHIFNAMHTTCTKCNGQGYAVYRQGRRVIRENVGCSRCLGLGVVPSGS
jgi:hypothetical protein